jgi:hypothetical protein
MIQQHHYYPAFCLRRLAGVDDQKLQFFLWHKPAGKHVTGRASPDSVCRHADLYALRRAAPEFRQVIESDVFTKKIDTPASDALRTIESKGVRALSKDERLAWARFLLSLPARSPEMVTTTGPQIARSLMDADPTDYEAARQPDDPKTLSGWAFKNQPGRLEDFVKFGIARMLDDEIHPFKLDLMHWWTRDLPNHHLITSDRPLLAYPQGSAPNAFNLDHPDCVLGLPIGPHKVFFAAKHDKSRVKLRQMQPATIARMVNDEAIFRKNQYVYAADDRLRAMISRAWFGGSDKCLGG